jgi:hypothetical protein
MERAYKIIPSLVWMCICTAIIFWVAFETHLAQADNSLPQAMLGMWCMQPAERGRVAARGARAAAGGAGGGISQKHVGQCFN